ncbi:tripartite tricarboxylate transporter permease [Humidisolicoccus flavus]|uniref:tripartite tricarboxylate transporter permease n=1 Tax=Humidisolicoccus flavus TaxID=3111414 RepID=UPI00324E7F1F
MNALLEGLQSLLSLEVAGCIGLGLVLGLLVGAFPGITATMAVALAAGFTLALDPVPGLAVLLTIYVAANFGDRIPSILVNTPGTPASIATTLDGYPMAKQGRAGLALTISAFGSALGIIASLVLFAAAAIPIATIARDYFKSPELFALVLFGLTVMIGISSKSVLKGLIAGVFGLLLGTVGTYSATADQRFTFGNLNLLEGLDFIAIIIGLFGIAELFDQLLTYHKNKVKPISSLGRWWPNKSEYKEMGKPLAVGGGVGLFVGLIPAAGGDIAGLIGWDRARAASKTPEKFGKGSIEGITASDTASSATLGGSLTTTMALGIPGDSVMAVMIGSMMIWGLQPGPNLFTTRPDLVVSITGIMLIATILSLVIALVRSKFMVKLLDLPNHYLWTIILVFCMVGTYATSNSIFVVITMLVFGVIGVVMKRVGIPAGPVVLGLLLGPLAEANLSRSLVLLQGKPFFEVVSPIAMVLVALSILSLLFPLLTKLFGRRKKGESLEDPIAARVTAESASSTDAAEQSAAVAADANAAAPSSERKSEND